MPTIRNSGELEEWGEEELRNLAGFANFSPLGLVLLRFLLEKIVFPQLEERIPGLEYACWKGWIIKPTPLLSTLRPLEGVSPQSSFIPGRQTSDNIVVTQELLHTVRKMKGKKGGMAVKIDLAKAYDRIDWSFLRTVLEGLHFPAKWISFLI